MRMDTAYLEPAILKPQSILSPQQSLSRERNEYAPSATYNSNTNKVELPFRASGEEYDDLIAYDTTRRYPMRTAPIWTKERIVMLILFFSVSIIIGFLSASLFHTIRTQDKCKFFFIF
jgi:hypothetical protein